MENILLEIYALQNKLKENNIPIALKAYLDGYSILKNKIGEKELIETLTLIKNINYNTD